MTVRTKTHLRLATVLYDAERAYMEKQAACKNHSCLGLQGGLLAAIFLDNVKQGQEQGRHMQLVAT